MNSLNKIMLIIIIITNIIIQIGTWISILSGECIIQKIIKIICVAILIMIAIAVTMDTAI